MDDVRGAGSLGQEVHRIANAANEVPGLEGGLHREYREFAGAVVERARSMGAGQDLLGEGRDGVVRAMRARARDIT